MKLFGYLLVGGLPLLLLWSFILTMIHVKKAGEKKEFLGRTFTFLGWMYEYTLSSFAAWFGVITLLFSIGLLFTGGFLLAIFTVPFGIFLVKEFFPRLNMPE